MERNSENCPFESDTTQTNTGNHPQDEDEDGTFQATAREHQHRCLERVHILNSLNQCRKSKELTHGFGKMQVGHQWTLNIIQKTLLEFDTSVFIAGRTPCNLWFADDISPLEGNEEELKRLTKRLEKNTSSVGYGMEISSEKCKILVNSIEPRSPTNIKMNGLVLEQVDQSKYLEFTQTTYQQPEKMDL